VTIVVGFIEKVRVCVIVVRATRVAAGVMLLSRTLLGLLALVTTRFCRFAALVVAPAAAVAALALALRYAGMNVGQEGG
jgi:hypothetical protein